MCRTSCLYHTPVTEGERERARVCECTDNSHRERIIHSFNVFEAVCYRKVAELTNKDPKTGEATVLSGTCVRARGLVCDVCRRVCVRVLGKSSVTVTQAL